MAEPPLKRPRTDAAEFVCLDDDEEEENEGKLDEKETLQTWLDTLDLGHLEELFAAAEIDLTLVEHLTPEDLTELGIDDENERRLILMHAKNLGGHGPWVAPILLSPPPARTAAPTRPDSVGTNSNMFRNPSNHHRGKITSFFPPLHQPRDNDQSLPDMRPIGIRFNPSLQAPPTAQPSTSSATTSEPYSSNASLLALAQSAPLPKDTTLSKSIPRWRRLPGTRMTVDCFSDMSKDLKGVSFWILSHFHSDHYRGLTRKFNKGVIVCSTVTGKLIEQRLKIPHSIVLTLPFNTPTVIEGSTLELIDANHCPGAAMILCETPNVEVPILHCGDCRLVKEHQNHPSLIRTRGKAMLILDTTYCDPQYTFPPQESTIDFVYNEIKREAFNVRCLIVVGSYTIGKERLVLEVARRLEKKVYVSKDKMSILDCCGLTPEYRALLTTDHLAAQIHLVPMFKVSKEGIQAILSHSQGRYTSAVGISPTGWTHHKEKVPGSKMGRRVNCRSGPISILQVPYSEHSSFNELVEFCNWYRPLEIVPSVGNDYNGPKTKKMQEWLMKAQSKLPSNEAGASAR